MIDRGYDPWWSRYCPERVALRHVRSLSARPDGACVYCGQRPPIAAPINVAERLNALGFRATDDLPMEPVRDGSYLFGMPDGTTAVEGRWITGEGPQGSEKEKGRGELSYRQNLRLAFVQWLSTRNPDDRA